MDNISLLIYQLRTEVTDYLCLIGKVLIILLTEEMGSECVLIKAFCGNNWAKEWTLVPYGHWQNMFS